MRVGGEANKTDRLHEMRTEREGAQNLKILRMSFECCPKETILRHYTNKVIYPQKDKYYIF